MIDREREIAELQHLLNEPGMRLAILYGRRRVGKTHLLTNVWPAEATFYFVASDSTTAINRKELVEEMARWSDDPLEPGDFPTWRTVFRELLRLRPNQPLAVILDEYQYLGEGQGAEDVDSQLLAVWETLRSEGQAVSRPLVVALCGSTVGVMERLDSAGRPLYGRTDWKHKLEPFDYFDTGTMVPFQALRDRAVTYGVFGGTPRYLEAVDLDAPLGQSIIRAVLDPRGEVRTQIETIIQQERGIQNYAQYNAILTAIASGMTERNEIAQATGLENDYGLRSMLSQLEELGYIRAERNFNPASNEPYRHRILDPALSFYHRFVLRFRSELERGEAPEIWDSYLRDLLAPYMGRPVFEMMAEQAYYRLRRRRDYPLVAEWGRWEGKDRDRESLEMDIVARLTDGRMMTGSIKWNARPCETAIHHRHVRDLDRLARSGKRWAHEALRQDAPLLYFAAGGFTEGFVEQAESFGQPVYTVTLEAMYEEP